MAWQPFACFNTPCCYIPRGLVVTKNVYFSLLTHTNQLLLVTLCHTPAVIENLKVGRDADADAAVRTDRRRGWNSYLDLFTKSNTTSGVLLVLLVQLERLQSCMSLEKLLPTLVLLTSFVRIRCDKSSQGYAIYFCDITKCVILLVYEHGSRGIS